ncbi:hypothetical protein BDZ94DRAFT_1268629 [Collybia nuda]|uniref:F-box domain-containing protein n=1 Tax=Collybia nuda TaxID=64659 RepID=A0A9P5Y0Y8_9AGAR|nr:hypothetical protein BDZ94DRAFT_1268629 [Collybia nuda]
MSSLVNVDPWDREGHSKHVERTERSGRMPEANNELSSKKYPVGQAPFQSLPPELLVNIFTLCKDSSSDAIVFPLTFGQICTYFRNVVHNSPSLWTTVELHLSNPEKTPLVGASLEKWAVRTGALPIDLTITVPESVPIHPTDVFFKDIVSPLQAKLKSLSINVVDVVHLFALGWLPSVFPLLEAVTIRLLKSEDISFIERRFINFHGVCVNLENCPRLRRFSLLHPPDPAVAGVMASGIIALPYTQLTSLSISAGLRIIPLLLQHCTQLVDFRLVLEDERPWLSLPSGETELVQKTIRRLEITCCHPVMHPFFLQFSFPALEHLKLRDTGLFSCGYRTKTMGSILTMVLQDAPFRLKHLGVELKGVCRDPRHLFPPLAYTPHLTHVEFKNCGFLNHPGFRGFSDLICGTSSKLEDLRSISFDDQVVSVGYGKILDIANLCVDSGIQPRLTDIRVCFRILRSNARDPTPIVDHRIRELRRRGLKLEISVECDSPVVESSSEGSGTLSDD